MTVTSTRTIVVGGRAQGPMTLARQLRLRALVSLVAAVVLGVWPAPTQSTTEILLGSAALVLGLTEAAATVGRRRVGEPWSFAALRALLGLGLGAYLLAWPHLAEARDLTTVQLAVVTGGVWLAFGLAELAEGVWSRNPVREGRWRVGRGLIVAALGGAAAAWPSITLTLLLRLVAGLLAGSGLLCLVSSRRLAQVGRRQRGVRLDVVS